VLSRDRIALRREKEINRVARRIHRPVQVRPSTRMKVSSTRHDRFGSRISRRMRRLSSGTYLSTQRASWNDQRSSPVRPSVPPDRGR
jgi:hypothetical protein